MARSHLLVLAEVTALAWVLAEQRMAFSAHSRSSAMTLEMEDELFLYTTRGCYHNPTRDRGRIIGIAAVKSAIRDLPEPVVFGERRYISGCSLSIEEIASFRNGLEFGPMVSDLHTFSGARNWGMSLRRPLVVLDPRDASRLRREVAPYLQPRDRCIDAYLEAARRRSRAIVKSGAAKASLLRLRN
jgi:hypothetical protein